jgi:dTDP-4-amino-4,6-dideoxygalactose transaminase
VIPFVDLKAQMRTIRAEVDAAIGRVLDSCHFTLGPEVAAFESEFAELCRRQEGVAVNTGTSALHLALLAAGIGPGDEVVTVPFTFVATVSAIDYTGARPVFVDIDPATLTMDPQALEAAITPRTRAIMPVHLYGMTADMDPILAVARRHGLLVIEDAAQAHAAAYRGRPAGSLGDMACFSFYPGKTLGACGEGGMVVTDDPNWARRLRMLRDWGAEQKYHHVVKGYNFRMEAIQGAVLRAKLPHLQAWTEARRRAAAGYDALLAASGLPAQAVPADRHHAVPRLRRAQPRAHAPGSRRCCSRASTPTSTTPRPCTCCRPSRSWAGGRVSSRMRKPRRARCCRCPCTRSSRRPGGARRACRAGAGRAGGAGRRGGAPGGAPGGPGTGRPAPCPSMRARAR